MKAEALGFLGQGRGIFQGKILHWEKGEKRGMDVPKFLIIC